MTPAEFLKTWHEAVLARDATALSGIISDDCVLKSPVVWKPTQDKDYLIHILQGVITVVEDFDYRHETVDGHLLYLEFTGSVAGKDLIGLDRITLNEDGLMSEIEVFVRPLNTQIEFATRMREHALAYKKPAGVTA